MSRAEPTPDRPSPRDLLVLTVDDQASFREVARRVVEVVAGFRWIGEACTGEEAVAFVGRHAPDLVVMECADAGHGRSRRAGDGAHGDEAHERGAAFSGRGRSPPAHHAGDAAQQLAARVGARVVAIAGPCCGSVVSDCRRGDLTVCTG